MPPEQDPNAAGGAPGAPSDPAGGAGAAPMPAPGGDAGAGAPPAPGGDPAAGGAPDPAAPGAPAPMPGGDPAAGGAPMPGGDPAAGGPPMPGGDAGAGAGAGAPDPAAAGGAPAGGPGDAGAQGSPLSDLFGGEGGEGGGEGGGAQGGADTALMLDKIDNLSDMVNQLAAKMDSLTAGQGAGADDSTTTEPGSDTSVELKSMVSELKDFIETQNETVTKSLSIITKLVKDNAAQGETIARMSENLSALTSDVQGLTKSVSTVSASGLPTTALKSVSGASSNLAPQVAVPGDRRVEDIDPVLKSALSIQGANEDGTAQVLDEMVTLCKSWDAAGLGATDMKVVQDRQKIYDYTQTKFGFSRATTKDIFARIKSKGLLG